MVGRCRFGAFASVWFPAGTLSVRTGRRRMGRTFAAAMLAPPTPTTYLLSDDVNRARRPFLEQIFQREGLRPLLPDGETLITSGYDGRLVWHNTTTRKQKMARQAHAFWSWQLAVSPDGSRIASVTGQYLAAGWKYEPDAEVEPSVCVLDTCTGKDVAIFSHIPPVQSCAFSPDGRYLAAGNLLGEVRVWDLEAVSGSAPVSKWTSADFTSWGTTKSHHYSGGIFALAFSRDGSALLGCGMGPTGDPMAGNGKTLWQLWNWRTGERRDQIKDGQHGTGLMEALDWHPDGKHFIMAGRLAHKR